MLGGMKISIITGASRGLGLAMAQQRLDSGYRVLAIARATPPVEHPALEAWRADLADAAPVAARLEAWLAAQPAADVTAVELINNAGVISRLAPLDGVAADDLANALRVGLEAPLLLSAAFLRATAGWAASRKLLLISSGLGRRAMAGSASYCTAKAGMDHLARAVALEQQALQAAGGNGARVCSLAPGVIDTDMQVQLRSADAAAFPERSRFEALKTGGALDSAATAAAKCLRVLDRDDFGANPVADVRDA